MKICLVYFGHSGRTLHCDPFPPRTKQDHTRVHPWGHFYFIQSIPFTCFKIKNFLLLHPSSPQKPELHLNVLQQSGNGSKSRLLLTECIIQRLPRSRRLAPSVRRGQASVGFVFTCCRRLFSPRIIPTIAFVSPRNIER